MKTKLILSLVSLLACTVVSAQSVTTWNDGTTTYPAIDCQNPMPAAGGIPTAALYNNGVSARTSQGWHGENDAANRIDRKFAIQSSNQSLSATANLAISSCPVGWRLPTQRELMLIYVMRAQINALGVAGWTTFNTTFYWSSTEASRGTTNAYLCHLGDGRMSNAGKDTSYAFRCVKGI